MRRPRGNHSSLLEAEVALAALKGDETMAELASRFDVHPHEIAQWKQQLVGDAASVYASDAAQRAEATAVDLKALHAKIGQQTLEIDFLAGALGRFPSPNTFSSADRSSIARMRVFVARQPSHAGVVSCVGSLHAARRSRRGPALMRRLDVLHLELTFAGSRMLRGPLCHEGIAIGRDDMRTLMARTRITAICRRPRVTSQWHPAHPVFPYLLRSLVVDRPNQVWARNFAYLAMAPGFVFLRAHGLGDVEGARLANLDDADGRLLLRRPRRRLWIGMAPQRSSTPIMAPSSPVRLPRGAPRARYTDQHGREGLLARQCVRRTALAHR